ncbi:uncharacterized protein C19orf44 homolog [Ctenodactylus gundi]
MVLERSDLREKLRLEFPEYVGTPFPEERTRKSPRDGETGSRVAPMKRSSHPARHSVFDVSDTSLEDSKMDSIGNLKFTPKLTPVKSGHSRFLKRRQMEGEPHFFSRAPLVQGSHPVPSSAGPPTTSSTARATAALSRLAQLETKVLSRRKAPPALPDSDSDPETSDRMHRTFQKQLHACQVTPSSVPVGGGTRFLKKRDPAGGNRSPGALTRERQIPPTPSQRGPAGTQGSPVSDLEELGGPNGTQVEPRGEERRPPKGLCGRKASEEEPRRPCTDSSSTEDMASPAYSEDFERSPSPSVSGPSEVAPVEMLDTLSGLSSSARTDLPTVPRVLRMQGRNAASVLVREASVQTLSPSLAHHWTEAANMAAIGPASGDTYMDPTPIASHVVSTDAIEALTAYSPAAVALDDLLRQQLRLTRQFVEGARQLHSTLLRSLDGDVFHYHTLEQAKEYIRCHRPPPLTPEDVLRQVKEEL